MMFSSKYKPRVKNAYGQAGLNAEAWLKTTLLIGLKAYFYKLMLGHLS